MSKPLTRPQLHLIRRMYMGAPDAWHRATCHGERVTYASLYYRGYALRRVHSGAGTTSPAHEYQLHPKVRAALARTPTTQEA